MGPGGGSGAAARRARARPGGGSRAVAGARHSTRGGRGWLAAAGGAARAREGAVLRQHHIAARHEGVDERHGCWLGVGVGRGAAGVRERVCPRGRLWGAGGRRARAGPRRETLTARREAAASQRLRRRVPGAVLCRERGAAARVRAGGGLPQPRCCFTCGRTAGMRSARRCCGAAGAPAGRRGSARAPKELPATKGAALCSLLAAAAGGGKTEPLDNNVCVWPASRRRAAATSKNGHRAPNPAKLPPPPLQPSPRHARARTRTHTLSGARSRPSAGL